MNKDLVTVMIPCYNGKDFLKTCFESLLAQDYENVQLIIINDGSIDESEDIILSYQQSIEDKGWTFEYIYQENAGAAAAINNGIKNIQGKYLMLYDVDDILYTNNISKKADYLRNNPSVGVVINDGMFLYEKTKEKVRFYQNKEYIEKDGLFNALLFEHAYNWPGTYMVRTEFLFEQLENKDIYISRYGQNLQVLLPVAYFYKTGIIQEPLMDYLVRAKSVSHTGDINKQLDLQKGFCQNRRETIKRLNIDEGDKKNILYQVDRWDFRKRFIFALNNNMKDELTECKKTLIELNDFHTKDYFRYAVGKYAILKKPYEWLHTIKTRSV